MNEEVMCLMSENEAKKKPSSKLNINYHYVYLAIIAGLSVLLMFSATRQNIIENVTSLYENNVAMYVNRDYTFESKNDFSRDHFNESILKRKVDNSTKFFNSAIKLAKPLKFILIWTSDVVKPMTFFKPSRSEFFKYGCELNNCFLTHNPNQIEVNGIENFDAILFHNLEFTSLNATTIYKFTNPTVRNQNQKYILFETESSSLYPICDDVWESYFNWTWTYKLNSEVVWDFFTIRNKTTKDIVAPMESVAWNETLGNLSKIILSTLENKTKSVAWFISDSAKELDSSIQFASQLKNEAKTLGFDIDIWNNTCPKDNPSVCMGSLRNDYKFYLSFERSDAVDYVTENFAKAMINFAVPIVLSGKTNYTRFAPPGSFIDAAKLSPKDVALLVKKSMDDFEDYKKYHMWRNGYVIHFSYDHYSTHPLCRLCKALNNPELTKTRNKIDLRRWWNEGNDEKNCAPPK